MAQIDAYNTIYQEQIAPLLEQVMLVCKEHRIPAFMAFDLGKKMAGKSYALHAANPKLQAAAIVAREARSPSA